MEEVYVSLVELEKMLKNTLEKLQQQQSQIAVLELENEQLRGKMTQLEHNLEKQQHKNMALQLLASQKVSQGKENEKNKQETVSLKLKINALIQDINYCINYLSKNE